MMRSMTRMAVAGCIAMAALGAAAMLDVGLPTADAAPSPSPFAGSYVGADPRGWNGSWDVTITDGGRIDSAYSSPGGRKRSISGRVGDDGTCSFTVSETVPAYRDRRDPFSSYPRYTISYDVAGTMTLDDGNIVGTVDGGGSFSWLRR
jgi:hypothetical protein